MPNPQPYISVLIPVYNDGLLLDRAIHSVLCQSFQDFEVLILDDGSTDNSYEKIQNWVQKDSRIKALHHEKNLGLFISRNDLIKNAHGKYSVFLDADDSLVAVFFQKLKQYTAERDFDMIRFSVHYQRRQEESFLRTALLYHGERKNRMLFGKDIFERYFWKAGLAYTLWGIAFYTPFLKSHILGYIPITLAEDLVRFTVMAYHAKSYLQVKDPAYNYFFTSGDSALQNFSLTQIEQLCHDIFLSEQYIDSFFESESLPDRFKQRFHVFTANAKARILTNIYTGLPDQDVATGLSLFIQYLGIHALAELLAESMILNKYMPLSFFFRLLYRFFPVYWKRFYRRLMDQYSHYMAE